MLLRLALFALSFALPAGASQAAQLAIIIDDVGYNRLLGERTARLPGAYTLALLPHTPHSAELAELAHHQNKELMLHAPMASQAGLKLGPGALTPNMSRREFVSSLRHSIAQIPYIKGLNNHMGSALTSQYRPMGWTMSEAQRANLYFIDSRTTAATVAFHTAQAYGVASASRDVFLDHERSREAIWQQLRRAVALAQNQGHAIAIGHPYPETLDVLEAASDGWLQEQGVQLVAASALTTRPTATRGTCPAPPPLLRQRPSFVIRIQQPEQPSFMAQLITFSYHQLLGVDKDDINNSG